MFLALGWLVKPIRPLLKGAYFLILLLLVLMIAVCDLEDRRSLFRSAIRKSQQSLNQVFQHVRSDAEQHNHQSGESSALVD